MGRRRHDLLGKRFTRLLVVGYSHLNRSGNATWNCTCDCGNETTVDSQKLKNGDTKSCGCRRAYKHGGTGTALYRCWRNMKTRCLNRRNHQFKDYGGRGIEICSRWVSSFENFALDMGHPPSPTHSIDRVNNDGNYDPSNCRWADSVTQNNNRRKFKRRLN